MLGKISMKDIEERYNKLSREGQKQFQDGYATEKIDLVKDSEAYDLLKDILDEEKIIKEGFKMVEKIVEDKVKEEDKKVVEVAQKGGALAETGRKLMVKKEMSLDEWKDTVKFLYDSRYFTDIQSFAQAMAKAQCGREMGFQPYFSLQHVFIIPGKPPAVDGQGMAAMIKNAGYDFRQIELDDLKCTVKFFNREKDVLGEVTFTYAEASKITQGGRRLVDKEVWKNYRQDMLWWRTISRGARRFCPDAISGAYLAEELDYDVVDGTASVVNHKKIEVEPPVAPKKEVTPEVPVKTRKDFMDELVAKYGKEKMKALKTALKYEGSLLTVSDESWAFFVKELEKPEPVKEVEKPAEPKKEEKLPVEKVEPKKEDIIDAVINELTREKKVEILEGLKEKFGTAKMKAAKEELQILGKLVDLDDKPFNNFVSKVEKGA